ncbi:MAG: MBOAT family O-acyltransferase [Eubacterium sp.]
MILILFGLLKKYTIANLLVHEIANILDAPTEKTPGSAIVFAILLYSAQQYADFSGGIDIVMGVAELFGIKMMPNFRQPYFSVSLGDFWRRWHISLGAWMRDYVFYPFALTSPMQKFGKWAKKHLNVHFGRVLPASIANILVFFLVGIWHGSQWHFIFWGLYNGIVIAVSDICAPLFAKITERLHINVKSKAFYLFRIIRTFIIVNIGWYFDRIYDIRDCFLCMKNTIFNFQMSQLDEFLGPILKIMPTKAYVIVTVALCIVFADSVIKERGKDAITLLDNRPLVLRWLLYFGMIFMILESFNFAVDAGGFMYANY